MNSADYTAKMHKLHTEYQEEIEQKDNEIEELKNEMKELKRENKTLKKENMDYGKFKVQQLLNQCNLGQKKIK